MKKILIISVLAILLLTGCTTPIIPQPPEENDMCDYDVNSTNWQFVDTYSGSGDICSGETKVFEIHIVQGSACYRTTFEISLMDIDYHPSVADLSYKLEDSNQFFWEKRIKISYFSDLCGILFWSGDVNWVLTLKDFDSYNSRYSYKITIYKWVEE